MDAVEWFKFNQIFFYIVWFRICFVFSAFFQIAWVFCCVVQIFRNFSCLHTNKNVALQEITRCFNENRNYSILFYSMICKSWFFFLLRLLYNVHYYLQKKWSKRTFKKSSKKINMEKNNEIQVFYLCIFPKIKPIGLHKKIYCVDRQFFRNFIVTVMLCSLLENEK